MPWALVVFNGDPAEAPGAPRIGRELNPERAVLMSHALQKSVGGRAFDLHTEPARIRGAAIDAA